MGGLNLTLLFAFIMVSVVAVRMAMVLVEKRAMSVVNPTPSFTPAGGDELKLVVSPHARDRSKEWDVWIAASSYIEAHDGNGPIELTFASGVGTTRLAHGNTLVHVSVAHAPGIEEYMQLAKLPNTIETEARMSQLSARWSDELRDGLLGMLGADPEPAVPEALAPVSNEAPVSVIAMRGRRKIDVSG